MHCVTKLGIKLGLMNFFWGGGRAEETNWCVIFVYFFVRLTSLSVAVSFSVEWLDDGKEGI